MGRSCGYLALMGGLATGAVRIYVRAAVLGHQQQGGNPSPFDRIQATRLAAQNIDFLINEAGSGSATSALSGMQEGLVNITNLEGMPRLIDAAHSRPKEQWRLSLKPLARLLSKPGAAQDASVPMKESKS